MDPNAQDPYVQALKALVEKLGPEKATLRVWGNVSAPAGLQFEIQPRNPQAARLSGSVGGDIGSTAVLSAGHSWVELFSKKPYGDPSDVADMIELCEAVMDGRFTEEVTFAGALPLRSRCVFSLKTTPFRYYWSQLHWRWILRKVKSSFTYEPYT